MPFVNDGPTAIAATGRTAQDECAEDVEDIGALVNPRVRRRRRNWR